MSRSVKYNYVLNLVNSLAGLLFPIVTFPYIARVLDPDGVGLVNFYQSIIQYITLFSSLGIGYYAVRELSRVRDDRETLNTCAAEILSLHLLLVCAGYLAVAVLCFTVERIEAEMKIFLILSTSVFFNAIGSVWFFQAVEDFKFITIRSLVVKLLAGVALFVFVKDKADVTVYAWVLAFADGGNYVLNFIRLNHLVKFHEIKRAQMRIFRHLKPSIKIFSLNVIISLYLNLSPVLLGFMSGDEAVGFFTAASRMQNAVLTVVTAMATTLVPRMSYYYSVGDVEKFISTERKGFTVILLLTLPIVAGMILVASDFIPLFAGEEFEPAVATMQIISPSILAIGVASLVGIQVLYPQGKEVIFIKSAAIGAVVSLVISVLTIPMLEQNGAALGYAVAEFTVTGMLLILGRKYISCDFFNRENFKVLVATAMMAVCVGLVKLLCDCPVVLKLMLEIGAGVIVYALALALVRNRMFVESLASLSSKFRRGGKVDDVVNNLN